MPFYLLLSVNMGKNKKKNFGRVEDCILTITATGIKLEKDFVILVNISYQYINIYIIKTI